MLLCKHHYEPATTYGTHSTALHISIQIGSDLIRCSHITSVDCLILDGCSLYCESNIQSNGR